jgi:hypothetical protein
MKNLLIAMTIIAAVFAGCKDDEEPVLTVDSAAIEAPAGGGNKTIAVTSNVSWTVAVSAGAPWCTVLFAVGEGDGTVQVNIAENQSTASRTATITLSAGALTKAVTVTQAATGATLSINKPVINAPAAAGTSTVAVTSNAAWTVAVSAGATWCTTSPASAEGNGLLQVNIAENLIMTPRAATVTLSAGALTKTVAVMQSAAGLALSLDRTAISAPSAGNSTVVAVTSNATWTATVSAGATWCTVSPISGSGNGSAQVDVAALTMAVPRAATVTFATGAFTKTLVVSQEGVPPTLTIDKTSLEAPCPAGTYAIVVTSNSTWTVTTNINAPWCMLSPASATGNGSITVTLEENQALTPRAVTITIASGALNETVALTQLKNTPPYAAGTQIWTFGDQTWSDAIHIPACDKEDFANSNTEPQCRSYWNYYYYNWPYVNTHAATTLCPSPWRVPTKADITALAAATTVENLVTAWGKGGLVDPANTVPSYTNINGCYWSFEQYTSTIAYELVYGSTPNITLSDNPKNFGLQVRCVR